MVSIMDGLNGGSCSKQLTNTNRNDNHNIKKKTGGYQEKATLQKYKTCE